MTLPYDVGNALEALGIEYTLAGNGYEANSICPQHMERTGRNDRSPSWWINVNTGMHICFSCGYKGSLLLLVCDLKDLYIQSWGEVSTPDYEAAKEWLQTNADVSMEVLMERLATLPAYVKEIPKPLEMTEARLAVFDEPPAEVLKARNITPEAARKYGILWNSKDEEWILPLRDPNFQKLLGWQEKGTVNRTFFNRPAGLTKSKTLFGVQNQLEEVVIVVESPLDCARIESAGISGAVAVCGSAISEEQIKLLRYSDKIIAAFDNDAAGRKASKEILAWSIKYGLNLFFFNYGDTNKKDPGDLTDAEIHWGVTHAVSSLYGEPAYVQGDAQALSS